MTILGTFAAFNPFICLGCMVPTVLCVTGLLGSPSLSAEPETTPGRQWTFDNAPPGSLPGSFTVGTLFDGRPAGEWKILITDRAQSASQVLAQVLPKGTDQAHKLLLVEGTESHNVDVTVSYLAVGGKADLGGGLIWRATDDRNYYLLRASLVEQKIRLYRVVKGVQQVVKQIDHPLSAAGWHRLRIMQRGCEIKAQYDEAPLFRVCDNTFSGGRIGLWTKADAVTYFDDLGLRLLE
ncbi:MAG: hypothetical protein OJF47_004058 [Nitrospira sp.]|jgi:hypothetical protein|nr:MAG: hypothetical protein OJF47_004058 [Nitrospira sp.]